MIIGYIVFLNDSTRPLGFSPLRCPKGPKKNKLLTSPPNPLSHKERGSAKRGGEVHQIRKLFFFEP
jgi:hypothetical protein